MKLSLIALSLTIATPAGAQQAPLPPGPEAANTESNANGTALAAIAAQTAKIMQEKAEAARNQQVYAQSQLQYERDRQAFEAAAKKAAADTEAYQRQMVAWQDKTSQRRQPAQKAPSVAAAKGGEEGSSRVVCSTETPTGSMMPVRRCRSVGQTARDKDRASEELQRVRQNSAQPK